MDVVKIYHPDDDTPIGWRCKTAVVDTGVLAMLNATADDAPGDGDVWSYLWPLPGTAVEIETIKEDEVKS